MSIGQLQNKRQDEFKRYVEYTCTADVINL